MRWLDLRSSIGQLGVSGVVQETVAGTLVRASSADGNARVYRSTDAGLTWSLRQTMTIPTGNITIRGSFIDSRGHIYMGGRSGNCTYENYGSAFFGEIWKSIDDGAAWTKACTSECEGFWHFAEDSTGRVYVNEYSATPPSGTEYPAVNIWRSDTAGANFAKWHTATKESSAGVRDGVRHIHTVHVDASDRVFAAYGDTGWTGDAGKVVRLNSSGVIDLDYGRFGNGSTAAIHNLSGMLMVGKDTNPSGVDALNPTLALSCQQCNLFLLAGPRYDAYVFDLIRSNDDVLFGLAVLATRYNSIIYSTNEGATWHAIDYGGTDHVQMSFNRFAPSGKVYISGGNVKTLVLPTKAVLNFRKPWYHPQE